MSKRKFIGILVWFLSILGGFVWAGDMAVFVDLGFSADGKHYMFAQYGVESETLKPWAQLFIVDVPKNQFVKGGSLSFSHKGPVVAGQDGSGALYSLIAQHGALAEKYRIDFLRQSQPLFIAVDDGKPQGTVEFRDFESGASYSADLTSYVEGKGKDLKSSFYITLERKGSDGSKKKYTLGNPKVKRELVESYRIVKVQIAPKDGSMIFVIEMRKIGTKGSDIRYMVEALRL
jgi:predicted secreted protein